MIEKNKIEIRQSGELLADDNVVFGKAISFDTPSDNLRFTEIIERGAVTAETLAVSDVYARFNHSDEYILARCRKGDPNGTLKLELRDDGLYYSFSLPNTEKGNEVRSHIERGELDGSSFSFVVAEDEVEIRDGKRIRRVKKIAYLVDVAPVYLPAYMSTSVSLRNADIEDDLEQRFTALEAAAEAAKSDETIVSNTPNETENNVVEAEDNREGEQPTEEVTEPTEGTTTEGKKNDIKRNDSVTDNDDDRRACGDSEKQTVAPTQEEKEENEGEAPKDTTDNNEKRQSNSTMKTQKFSLIDAINDVVENRKTSPITEAVNRAGRDEMKKCGKSYSGQITIPVGENRGIISVDTEGDDTVGIDVFDIMKPLQAKLVFAEAGAKFLSGLKNDVQVPVMSKAACDWESEIDDADISFSSVSLKPHRLTTSCVISKTFLTQANDNAESYITNAIIDAIAEKLEETALNPTSGAETTKKPAYIGYDVTPTEITDFADLTEFEAELDAANVGNERKYILSNKAKAYLRNMTKGESHNLVYENGEVDGTAAYNTSNMGTDKTLIYGDWSNLLIGQWGSLDLVIDPLTMAKKNAIVITVSALFDVKVARPEAFVFGEIVTE